MPDEVRADLERLILSGSRVLEFLASQGCTALGNLVLSRRDSLLADVRSTVPAEEVARLRYSSSRDGLYLSVSPAGFSIDQDAGGCERRSSSTHSPPAQDSSETCGCWIVGVWFRAGELLWCSSCSEADVVFFPFWPGW